MLKAHQAAWMSAAESGVLDSELLENGKYFRIARVIALALLHGHRDFAMQVAQKRATHFLYYEDRVQKSEPHLWRPRFC